MLAITDPRLSQIYLKTRCGIETIQVTQLSP